MLEFERAPVWLTGKLLDSTLDPTRLGPHFFTITFRVVRRSVRTGILYK